ncbi:MAG: hypothetical protein HOD97_02865 [Candidatus Marinimicrobia bacterium]|nr:hypothetical protein [Candidatus Neomarinimicrobiota bacterium]MBT3617815.1 hypothetical protein [Candidatus Neomarinimicrobiota bacterium]MBT3828172.1 hypothetical protein [Candidatus Neomarinimicrobiota bacterium]MBT3997089.1 hypothetical protein [Candidatus Neomarinimicrobiota bacterium]MBT4280555.1 hypothetical protein [Candidatus Neomarinimicrobiota bacterium]
MKNIIKQTVAPNILIFAGLVLTMCAPPVDTDGIDERETARLDSLRRVKCPRLMSSAAEYYKNRDWESTVRVYGDIVDLGCDQLDPKGVYLYYAIAYEYLGKFDQSESVLLQGLQILPDNVELRKRLAYSYKKQNKLEEQIEEYDRLTLLAPDDIAFKKELAELYGSQKRYSDQIIILKEILNLDPDNESAQGDLANAYELSGKDPMDVFEARWLKNQENVSYGIDYADRLVVADRPSEATNVLRSVLNVDRTSKIAWRKLAEAYYGANDLEKSADSYGELFKLGKRDHRVAIKISSIQVELDDFENAIRWVNKAISISAAGESFAQKGNVYYKAFQFCRSRDISIEDKIVATLAKQNYEAAEAKGFRRYKNSLDWLKANEVLFGKAEWFMMDKNRKLQGSITPNSQCYNWIKEELKKDSSW